MSNAKDLTGRDAYVMVEALTFAIEALSGFAPETSSPLVDRLDCLIALS
jgi:hypothetical protein